MEISLKDIMAFFEMTSSEFAKEWRKMTDSDKAQIKKGLTDGTFNY